MPVDSAVKPVISVPFCTLSEIQRLRRVALAAIDTAARRLRGMQSNAVVIDDMAAIDQDQMRRVIDGFSPTEYILNPSPQFFDVAMVRQPADRVAAVSPGVHQ